MLSISTACCFRFQYTCVRIFMCALWNILGQQRCMGQDAHNICYKRNHRVISYKIYSLWWLNNCMLELHNMKLNYIKWA